VSAYQKYCKEHPEEIEREAKRLEEKSIQSNERRQIFEEFKEKIKKSQENKKINSLGLGLKFYIFL